MAMAVGGTRQKLSMIATVTNQGKTRWMIINEVFDTDKRIEFLQALIKDAGKKVFLILDNLRVHHSKLVKAWVADVPAMHDHFEFDTIHGAGVTVSFWLTPSCQKWPPASLFLRRFAK